MVFVTTKLTSCVRSASISHSRTVSLTSSCQLPRTLRCVSFFFERRRPLRVRPLSARKFLHLLDILPFRRHFLKKKNPRVVSEAKGQGERRATRRDDHDKFACNCLVREVRPQETGCWHSKRQIYGQRIFEITSEMRAMGSQGPQAISGQIHILVDKLR